MPRRSTHGPALTSLVPPQPPQLNAVQMQRAPSLVAQPSVTIPRSLNSFGTGAEVTRAALERKSSERRRGAPPARTRSEAERQDGWADEGWEAGVERRQMAQQGTAGKAALAAEPVGGSDDGGDEAGDALSPLPAHWQRRLAAWPLPPHLHAVCGDAVAALVGVGALLLRGFGARTEPARGLVEARARAIMRMGSGTHMAHGDLATLRRLASGGGGAWDAHLRAGAAGAGADADRGALQLPHGRAATP
jgi:hypothetical protein